ncbi:MULTISPECIES: hypothetical protein [unclassified Streptomyces]|uniref:hypothetical protein n=1 Tax=unclassified Streptomyces TaxID=2593676 RepID=UPI000FDA9064|nr:MULTISPECIES: hypothetical protein [unclassified Streptomyces]MBJ6647144.1 hypothetical protein [Streptomyces sp. BSE7-9]
MTAASNKQKRVNKLKIGFIVSGLLFTLGWAAFAATNEYLVYSAGRAAIVIPMVVGSILFPVGLIFDSSMNRLLKLLIVVACGTLLFCAAFFLYIFEGIAIHGLGPRQ